LIQYYERVGTKNFELFMDYVRATNEGFCKHFTVFPENEDEHSCLLPAVPQQYIHILPERDPPLEPGIQFPEEQDKVNQQSADARFERELERLAPAVESDLHAEIEGIEDRIDYERKNQGVSPQAELRTTPDKTSDGDFQFMKT
jgi:hypothetical protein